jgi:hypothetical protein
LLSLIAQSPESVNGQPEERRRVGPEKRQLGEPEKKKRRLEAAREDGDIFDRIGTKKNYFWCIGYSCPC